MTKQLRPTHGTREGYHFKFFFQKDETIPAEQAMEFVKEWTEEYLAGAYDYACSVHKDRDHMHMHLVFNSVSRSGGKYRYQKGDWGESDTTTDKPAGRKISYRIIKGKGSGIGLFNRL